MTLELEVTSPAQETTQQPVVQVRDLVITYGKNVAVDGLDLDVYAGESVGLLGDNGAGKSSTMKALATVNPATSGSIFIAGNDLADVRDAEKARNIIGYCPDVGGLIRSATIREHIGLSLRLHHKEYLWDQALKLVDRFNLTRVLDQPTSGFSHGMSRRLSVILAAISSDKLLILDEPFDGVDPIGVDTTISLIEDAKAAGVAIVLSTHLQNVLVRATDRIVVVIRGKVVDSGPSSDFEGEAGVLRYRRNLEANGL